jgi:primosomal protein N' (replication factor Y)
MVAKGLDFGGVEVVGVLNADALLNIPDFRSAERAFNMIEQVSGRAGRRAGGLVVIQTFNPRQPVLAFAAAHDYTGFYNYELEQRRQFGYPPFCRVVNIFLKHRDAKVVAECATAYAARLRAVLGDRVHGPQEPPVARVQAMYIRRIMLKVENKVSMARVKEILRQEYISQQASPLMRGLSLHYDVDPV